MFRYPEPTPFIYDLKLDKGHTDFSFSALKVCSNSPFLSQDDFSDNWNSLTWRPYKKIRLKVRLKYKTKGGTQNTKKWQARIKILILECGSWSSKIESQNYSFTILNRKTIKGATILMLRVIPVKVLRAFFLIWKTLTQQFICIKNKKKLEANK